jgi:imidazole glycerol-phosphate synthase subunit HisH
MIALIDYNMGNLRSVSNALDAVGANYEIIDNGSKLSGFEKIILPGVGNFGDGMEHLEARGFVQPIKDAIAADIPFLGVCVGLQMLFDSSEEAPNAKGLGIIKGSIIRFPAGIEKVPHMGWNNVTFKTAHPLLEGVPSDTYFYFVHSYHADAADQNEVIGECEYIRKFPAIVGRGNLFATQFHPEKSQAPGLQIYKNFVGLQS